MRVVVRRQLEREIGSLLLYVGFRDQIQVFRVIAGAILLAYLSVCLSLSLICKSSIDQRKYVKGYFKNILEPNETYN